jgi:xanthine dehydrogenase YagR molybdenum-binding subunit
MTATETAPPPVGAPIDRLEGPLKVRGAATYAYEQAVEDPAYVAAVQAPIAAGRVVRIDAAAALAEPRVLAVLTHENAPRLSDATPELRILQSDAVSYRGQIVAGVIAETLEDAAHAARLVEVDYERWPHDVELRADRDDLYAPAQLNAGFATETAQGDVDDALAASAVRVEETYTTPATHSQPMEPHATIAVWSGEECTIYISTQGVHPARAELATAFGLAPERVRVVSPHVGGAFGSKVHPHPDAILAVMSAQRVAGRPVKLALTRQQMFTQVGHRTPTIQRVRLGADAGGRLTAISHEVVEHTAKLQEFAEQTTAPTRTMYAAPHRRTAVRLAALDVPVPSIVRGPGEVPGMFALESAMDELAIACRLDPVELRVRNEPTVAPEGGLPFSSRHLVECLREGARRFGWDRRDPTPGVRRRDGWLVGTGVAASTYPVFLSPGMSEATARMGEDGRCTVLVGAADLGTGTRTALTQVAAEALGVRIDDVELRIGDTTQPRAISAGGSRGMMAWGSAVHEAARKLRDRLEAEHGGDVPAGGLEVTAATPDNPYAELFSMHSFGAQFAEVRVREDSGEVRVSRLLGVFAAGQIVNAKTARSQLLGGMTMGLSMALHEASVLDPRQGTFVNHDLAGYHIATNADVGSVEVHLLPEDDPYVNPLGAKGIGELGIVGTAAAIANAVHHATGVRVRDLPITPEKAQAEPPAAAPRSR